MGTANESHQLHRRHRLVEDRDFRRVRNEGRSWPHPLLVLFVRSRSDPVTRFGIVVGKHVGSAVKRNRVKRRIREVVRRRLPKIRSGVDLIFVARSRSGAATYGEIEFAVDQVLRRAGLQVS